MTVKSVLVHSCRIRKEKGAPRDCLVSGYLYVGELGIKIGDQSWYYPLPESCRCKRRVSVAEATEFEARGWAVWILQFKRRKGEVVLNDEVSTKIWMPVVRERVPRVDLISRADVERAYIGSERKSSHYKYFPVLKMHLVVQGAPEGKTLKEWLKEAEEEKNFEARIRRQFYRYIEDCHELTMDFRAKLLVPFQPDPFEGRVLFPFSPDQRTMGGHQEMS